MRRLGTRPIHIRIVYEGLDTIKDGSVEITGRKITEAPVNISYFSITNILLILLILILLVFLVIWIKDRNKKKGNDLDYLLKK